MQTLGWLALAQGRRGKGRRRAPAGSLRDKSVLGLLGHLGLVETLAGNAEKPPSGV